jgi:hypothetical protein
VVARNEEAVDWTDGGCTIIREIAPIVQRGRDESVLDPIFLH